MTTRRVLVASRNQVKADAAWDAFAVFSDLPVEINLADFTVESGVRDQPLSLQETAQGALNRLDAIRKVGGYAYYVAIEGGAYAVDLPNKNQWYESACAAVVKSGRTSEPVVAYGPAYPIPPKIAAYLEEGKDLNEAMRLVTGIKRIGDSVGFNGWLTRNQLDRRSGSMQAVLLALHGLERR